MNDGDPSQPSGNRTRSAERSRKRREQQRSVESQLAILQAALTEFAEMGFEGASMRRIGERAGLHYTLITYHFRSKEALWEAVAEHFLAQISTLWEAIVTQDEGLDAIDRVREEYRTFLQFTMQYPDFHHFMMRESRAASPRLPLLMDTFLAPVMQRSVSQIEAAQREGDLPLANPILIHYLLIGVTTVLSALGAEIRYNSGMQPEEPTVMEEYWTLIDQLVFKRKLFREPEPTKEG